MDEKIWQQDAPLTLPALDLHCHSTASDGTCTPTEVAQLAARRHLYAAALTDHDTVAGVEEFLAAGEAAGQNSGAPLPFRPIPGVELATRYGARELHIVGLFIDHRHPDLAAYLARQQEQRRLRGAAMQQKLATLGLALNDEELAAAGGGDTIGRPHFAAALTAKYPERFPSMDAAFRGMLRRGTPGYVMRNLPPPGVAIALIHAIGGVAVWAHPIFGAAGERNFARRVGRFLRDEGLDGIEVVYSEFTPEQQLFLQTLAVELKLAPSGGSDFHGAHHAGVALGSGRGALYVPADYLPGLERRRGPRVIVA